MGVHRGVICYALYSVCIVLACLLYPILIAEGQGPWMFAPTLHCLLSLVVTVHCQSDCPVQSLISSVHSRCCPPLDLPPLIRLSRMQRLWALDDVAEVLEFPPSDGRQELPLCLYPL